MKLVKSLLLGSAAGLAAVAGAQAADLPSKKAAPVEYVRVCSAHGAGFFYIPGSDTCIKIGGRARFEYQYQQTFDRATSMTGMRALGRIELDARNSTEYGLLRAYTRIDIARRTGTLHSGTGVRQGTAITGSGVDFVGATQTQILLDRAFIQLGGLTAGRSVSFFGFYNGDLEMVNTTMGDGLVTNLLAYTATFGSGFSATLSLEDPIERRQLVVGQNSLNTFIPNRGVDVANDYPLAVGAYTSAAGANPTVTGYGGAAMPDIVGALRVDQSWGSAQLSGALHQVRPVGNTIAASPTPGLSGDTVYGFAFNGGVKFNLPMIAAGDAFYLQAAYSNGASSYTFNNWYSGGAMRQGAGSMARLPLVDAVVLNNGSVETTQVWAITASGLHYWTPTVRQALFASYGSVNFSGNLERAQGGPIAGNVWRDWNYWTVGTNAYWSPIKGLDIGAEVDYQNYALNSGNITSGNNTGPRAAGVLANSQGVWTTRLRIQRDF